MPSSTAARIDRMKRQAARGADVIFLGGGLPDARSFPKRELGDAFIRALHQPREALQYGWPEGDLELREWIAGRLREAGANLTPENVVVTNGAQQAISLAARAIFSPGMMVGLTDESYPGAIETFGSLGLEVVSWHRRASGYYLMPSIDNPRGQSMATDARTELLRRLDKEGSTLIEDDAYAETRFDGEPGRPLLADAPEHVIHIGTLSKILCPGLRIGWLATRHPALPRILAEKQQTDLQAPSLSQRIVAEYLRGGVRFERHLSRVRRVYETKAKLLQSAVARDLPHFHVKAPRGGFSLWLEHQDPDAPASDLTLLASAIRRGVTFDPGRSFRIRDSKRLALRLCYGSATEEDIERGVTRLADAFEEVRLRGGRTGQPTLRSSGLSLQGSEP